MEACASTITSTCRDKSLSVAATFASCVAGYATSGSIKIGNITTPVVRPVKVQFGFWTGPNQNYYADAVPPIAGLPAMLSTKPDLIEASVGTPPVREWPRSS